MKNKQAPTPSRHLLAGALPLLASLALAACASVGVSGTSAQDQVRQRATERWQALAAGEFSRAYSYITPGYRAVVSPDLYRSRFGNAGVWLGGEVLDVNCPEATKCLARLRTEFKPLLIKNKIDRLTTYIEETWFFEDGQWWFFQDIKGN